MPQAVIVATARTPIGRAMKGSLKDVRADDLAFAAVRAALEKVPNLNPSMIDDLMLGCAEPEGEQGVNLARRVAVHLGLDGVPGTTVNRFCASSVQTSRMAFHAIRAGEGQVFVSAGVEAISRHPARTGRGPGREVFHHPAYEPAKARTAERMQSNAPWRDPREGGDLPDIYIVMGQTAENVASLRGISRREQDEFGVRSQNLAEKAIADGFFEREITPVTTPAGTVVSTDDGPRPAVTYEAVAGLRPAFREGGTVTPGNCCALNDGAAALVIMSDTKAGELGIRPLARIVATAVSALSPEIMGLGPIEATRRVLARTGMAIGDMDLVEMNEAFAAQVIPCYRELGVDLDRLNVHGGAIALGHPFGMTGARITTTLINGLQTLDKEWGLLTLCVGGGQGMAMILQRLS